MPCHTGTARPGGGQSTDNVADAPQPARASTTTQTKRFAAYGRRRLCQACSGDLLSRNTQSARRIRIESHFRCVGCRVIDRGEIDGLVGLAAQ